MPWTRLDDNVLDHPKIVGLSLEAEAVFYRGCVYVNRQQSQGFIPTAVLPLLARGKGRKQREAIAAALVGARLWHVAPGGWEVHDWRDYARPPRDADALREAGARGGRRSVEVRLAKYGSAQPRAEANPEATPKPLASKPLEARATGRDGEGLQEVLEDRPVEGGEPLDTRLIDRQFRVVAP